MKKLPLYSIGHGNREASTFLALLKEYSIDYLIDVRSIPYSNFNPQFRQEALKSFLEKNNIQYVFMGDALGGRPADLSCYDPNGRIDYKIVETKDFFRQGIERLKTAYEKNIRVAIMCSESNPCHCHRSRLIGRALTKNNITVQHIDETGKLKDQATVIYELNNGFPDNDLFGNPK